MKKTIITAMALLLSSCSSDESQGENLTTIKDTAEKYSPSAQIHETLNKAKNVEDLLQQSKDKRDAEMNSQLQ